MRDWHKSHCSRIVRSIPPASDADVRWSRIECGEEDISAPHRPVGLARLRVNEFDAHATANFRRRTYGDQRIVEYAREIHGGTINGREPQGCGLELRRHNLTTDAIVRRHAENAIEKRGPVTPREPALVKADDSPTSRRSPNKLAADEKRDRFHGDG